jgi:hypothetical protein
MSFVAFKKKLKNKHREFVGISKLRKYPHTPAVVCCYLLSFICGYHEYGTESVLKTTIEATIPMTNSDSVTVNWSYPLSQWVLGVSYILFAIPVGYVLGQKIGHKWSMVLGQVIMYVHGLTATVMCSEAIDCGLHDYFLVILVPFMLGFVIMNVNFILLALEQVDNVFSEAKGSFINWLWFFFFLGRGSTVFVTSSILFWGLPVYAFLIKVGFAVIAVSLLIWMPFERGTRGSISLPFSNLYTVCKEALKRCRCSCKKRVESPVPTFNWNQEEFPIDHRPNAFQRATDIYGGPLPLGEVRVVQEVILISCMLSSFIGIFIIYSLMYSAYSSEVGKMKIPEGLLNQNISHICPTPGVEYNEPNFPMGWISVIADLTTILSIAILNFFIYARFPDRFTIHTRIMLGTIFGFLTSLSSVLTEATRYGLSEQNTTTYITGFTHLRNSPARLFEATENMPLFSCVPQYVLYGVMTAFIIPTTSELAGVSAPVEFRPLLFGVYFTVMGVSMTVGGLIMAIQMRSGSIWCFYCGKDPKTGLMTFIITTLITVALFLLYLVLNRWYRKVKRMIDPHINPDANIAIHYRHHQHTVRLD